MLILFLFVVLAEVPKIQPFQFPTDVQLGYKASIMCMVSTDQTSISYEWYKDGRKLKSNGNINIDTNKMFSTLVINPVEENSIGNYTCKAKSEFGQDYHSTVLYVRCK